MFRITRRRVLAGAAAFTVAGAGVAAAFVVPALAAPSNPASASSAAAAASPSPATAPTRKHGAALALGALALGHQLAEETAKETGLSRKQLLADLRNGETLDQIAGSKAQSVLSTVLAADQSKLNAAEQSGKITAAQEQNRVARLRSEATAIMSLDLAPFLPPASPASGSASPTASETAA